MLSLQNQTHHGLYRNIAQPILGQCSLSIPSENMRKPGMSKKWSKLKKTNKKLMFAGTMKREHWPEIS